MEVEKMESEANGSVIEKREEQQADPTVVGVEVVIENLEAGAVLTVAGDEIVIAIPGGGGEVEVSGEDIVLQNCKGKVTVEAEGAVSEKSEEGMKVVGDELISEKSEEESEADGELTVVGKAMTIEETEVEGEAEAELNVVEEEVVIEKTEVTIVEEEVVIEKTEVIVVEEVVAVERTEATVDEDSVVIQETEPEADLKGDGVETIIENSESLIGTETEMEPTVLGGDMVFEDASAEAEPEVLREAMVIDESEIVTEVKGVEMVTEISVAANPLTLVREGAQAEPEETQVQAVTSLAKDEKVSEDVKTEESESKEILVEKVVSDEIDMSEAKSEQPDVKQDSNGKRPLDENPEHVQLGPKIFQSGVEMFTYFYDLLHAWAANINMNKYEHMVLSDLIHKGHRDAESKVGAGILAFQVRYHPGWHSRCYYLVRTDGSVDDFSYRKCVDKLMPLPESLFSANGDLVVDRVVGPMDANKWAKKPKFNGGFQGNADGNGDGDGRKEFGGRGSNRGRNSFGGRRKAGRWNR